MKGELRHERTSTSLVVGAGFAGLETAFHLRHSLGDRVQLTIISEQPYFLFKPNTIYIPFGLKAMAKIMAR